MTIVESTRPITGGVDTHLDVHVAAALDANGGVLGVESFPTTTGRVRRAARLAGAASATLDRVGVEGTGAYGAGLARFLRGAGVVVIEVDRPNRQARRRHGKSDTLDAIEAARAALSRAGPGRSPRPPTATSKRSGCCWSPTAPDATHASSVSTRSAISASPPPMTCGNGSVASPSPALAETRRGAAPRPARRRASSTPPSSPCRPSGDASSTSTPTAPASTASSPTSSTRPRPSLLELHGVGVHTAAILLVAAGDNAERITLRSRLRPPLRRRPDPRLVRQDRPATGSTAAATAKPTTPCGGSCSPA